MEPELGIVDFVGKSEKKHECVLTNLGCFWTTR